MTDRTDKRLFCFGLGYSAMALVKALAARSHGSGVFQVAGTTRDAERAELFATRGIEPFPFDGTEALAEGALDGTTHILVSVPPGTPPPPGGDPVLRWHADDIAALADAAPGLEWVGYLSTTGVYGNRDGGWVDEGSALRPTADRSRARVEAERAWLRLHDRTGVPVHIFRLAGIYGPGRSAFDQLRAGKARRIVKPGHSFSRIHVDDIAAVLMASIARPRPGAVYNVCDDEPAAPADIIAYAAELMGVAPPPEIPFGDADLSAMARSFWADNRRVRNTRIKKELGVALSYPDYRAGLDAIWAGEEGGS